MLFDTQTFKLDINEFIELKKDIVEKYSYCLELNHGNESKDIKNFIQTLDKYILNIIEEIIEYRDSKNKYEVRDLSDHEIIDIVAYLASLQYILEKNIKDEEIKEYIKEKNIVTINPNYKEHDELIDRRLMDVINHLIEIRRYYPERKWHKESNRTIKDKVIDINMDKFISYTRNDIVDMTNLFIYIIRNEYNLDDISIINDLYIGKHNKIMKTSI